MEKKYRMSEKRIMRLIAFGVLLYAIVMNLDSVSNGLEWVLHIISPVMLGLIIALVLNVPVHGFEKLFERLDKKNKTSAKLRSAVALILSVILVPVVLVLLLNFVVPQFINAISNVVIIVRDNETKISEFVSRIGIAPEVVEKKLEELLSWATTNVGVIAGTAVNTVVSMFSSVADVVLSLILALYILADKVALKLRARRLVRAFLPEKYAAAVVRVASMFSNTFATFLGRQCLEAVILGVILLLCMLIFGLPYSITVACMTALLALIPYVGAYLSLAIGCVLIITVSPMKALIFAAIFLVAQQVEGNLIYPRVVGKSVGLPAYITLAAVMVGGAIAGIVGMFFIIPVASVIYMLLREQVQKRNKLKDAQAMEAAE